MAGPSFDVAVVGAGIVGLATARELQARRPGARIVVLDKEDAVGTHQTGHNSGVIHAGVYYRPGSEKARMCRAGNASMVAFCREQGIRHEICGKVIVASGRGELTALAELESRARTNGLEVHRLGTSALRDVEPHVAGVAGLLVPSTGIVDFGEVCRAYARLFEADGGALRLGARVVGLRRTREGRSIQTDADEVTTRYLVNCAGLHSDRIARLDGVDPGARIVPFRGEYYELVPERRHLVRGLVYPVPNPDFPFLGVHLTKTIDGGVHAGPNAVPGLAREGYRKRDIDLRDVGEVLRYRGFWRLARRNAGEGAKEVGRSLSRRAFVRSLRRLVPEIGPDDVVPAPAGVRAQALAPDGSLVDDFLLVTADGALHVCNAPSPAATASLEIARAIADRVPA